MQKKNPKTPSKKKKAMEGKGTKNVTNSSSSSKVVKAKQNATEDRIDKSRQISSSFDTYLMHCSIRNAENFYV